jgi:mono/diheme cytochrome c family protein
MPITPSPIPDLERGQSIYRAYCAACHGIEGSGDASGFGDASYATPVLAGQRFGYLIHRLDHFSRAPRDSAHPQHMISSPAMGRPEAWANTAAYLSQLPSTHFAQTGDGTNIASGERLYRAQCAACHQDDARGDAKGAVPALNNQHYSYLAVRIEHLAIRGRPTLDAESACPPQAWDTSDIAAVADYLSRQGGPRAPASAAETE